MRTRYIFTTIMILILYYAAVYYVGRRLSLSFAPLLDHSLLKFSWMIYSGLSAAYIAGRVGQISFPGNISRFLIRIGAYWLGFFFYLFLLWCLFDLWILIAKRLSLLQPDYMPSAAIGAIILLVTTILFCYGLWRARHPQLTRYSIDIRKPCRKRELHIVVVSDLHLGLLLGRLRLRDLINRINVLQPDLVLFPGDLLDENVGTFLDEEQYKEFYKLNPSAQVFACLGSHEYILGHPEKALSTLRLAGIRVLQDEVFQTADGVYIVGRDDLYREKISGNPRKSLEEILAECDSFQPLILLDHNPSELSDALRCGIDLQISGHTHGGQMFPLTLLTKMEFKLNHGYFRQGNFHAIVSSGYGTWLTPLRIGSTPELVSISLKFIKN